MNSKEKAEDQTKLDDRSGEENGSPQGESHLGEVQQLENTSIMRNIDDDCTIIVNEYEDCTIIANEDEDCMVIANEDEDVSDVEECYDPFDNPSGCDVEEDSNVSTLSGPFADNRPICECNTIKNLMSRTETRYLLSLLPDMEEMSPHQKSVFKAKVVKLVDDVLTDVN
uniref:BESS domain-containing protein n=1 Tax=Graphocephala atropunctata TaxID=36148 RepID=A0A1B6ML88_9HEMI